MRISDDDMLDAIAAALTSVDPELPARAIAERVVAALGAGEWEQAPAILTVSGRVLLDFIVHPGTSLQESADRLGLTSPTVAHVMTSLVGAGWGVRTRSRQRTQYRFDRERVVSHRDIAAVLRAVGTLYVEGTDGTADIT